VAEGIQAAAPHIAAGAVMAQREGESRRPNYRG